MGKLWLQYTPGTLIHERAGLCSAWDVRLPELDSLWVGRVESYWSESHGWKKRWRSMDYRYSDFRDGYGTREQAAQELVEQCQRVRERIARRRERLELAARQPGG